MQYLSQRQNVCLSGSEKSGKQSRNKTRYQPAVLYRTAVSSTRQKQEKGGPKHKKDTCFSSTSLIQPINLDFWIQSLGSHDLPPPARPRRPTRGFSHTFQHHKPHQPRFLQHFPFTFIPLNVLQSRRRHRLRSSHDLADHPRAFSTAFRALEPFSQLCALWRAG